MEGVFIRTSLIIYVAICFVNVISGTVKTVLTVKASPIVASIVNTISCTINAVVVKFTSDEDLLTIIIVSILANLIGVYAAKRLIEALQKDKLWVYNATIKCTQDSIENTKDYLKMQYNIPSTWISISDNQLYEMKIYTRTKDESRVVKNQLNCMGAKYHIIEPR